MFKLARLTFKILWITLAFLLVLWLILLALVAIPTTNGWLTEKLSAGLSRGLKTEFKAERITGFLPFSFGLENIELADKDGPYGYIEGIDVQTLYGPFGYLFTGHISLSVLELRGAHLERVPEKEAPKQEVSSAKPLTGSGHSLSISVTKLRASKLVASNAVVRHFAPKQIVDTPLKDDSLSLSLAGSVQWDQGQGAAQITANLHPTLRKEAYLRLDATFVHDEANTQLALQLSEPETGFFHTIVPGSAVQLDKLSIDAKGPTEAWQATIHPKTEPSNLAPLQATVDYKGSLGLEKANLHANIALQPTGDIELQSLSGLTPELPLLGYARIKRSGEIEGSIKLTVPDIRKNLVNIGYDLPISIMGHCELELSKIHGTIKDSVFELTLRSPRIEVNRHPIQNVHAAIRANLRPEGFIADLEIKEGCELYQQALTGAAKLRFETATRLLKAEDINLQALGSTVKGTLQYDKKLEGQVHFDVALKNWSKIAGKPLEGQAEATLTFTHDQQQLLQMAVHAENLSFASSKIKTLDISSSTIEDPFRKPLGSFSCTAQEVSVGRYLCPELKAGLTLDPTYRLEIQGSHDGSWPEVEKILCSLDLVVTGLMDQKEGFFALERCQVKVGSVPFSLDESFEVSIAPNLIATNRLKATLAGAPVELSYFKETTAGELFAKVDKLDLRQLVPTNPESTKEGLLSFEGKIRRQNLEASGIAQFLLENYKGGEDPSNSMPALSLKGSLVLSEAATSIEAKLTSLKGYLKDLELDDSPEQPVINELKDTFVTLTADLPYALNWTKLFPSLNAKQSQDIAGSIDVQGNLSNLLSFTVSKRNQIEGIVSGKLLLSGTIHNPDVQGQLLLTKGSYFNIPTQLRFQDVTATLTGHGSRLEITGLEASDGATGRITGKGSALLDISQDLAYELELNVDKGMVYRSENFVPVASTKTPGIIRGNLHRTEILADLIVHSCPIYVTQKTAAASLPRIKIVYENEEAPYTNIPESRHQLDLDITFEAVSGITFDELGLKSEWRTKGPVALHIHNRKTELVGTLEAVHGSYMQFTKLFNIERGTVSIGGANRNIQVDLLATLENMGYKYSIHVQGSRDEPRLTLSSEPPLPTSEILAHILFAKNLDHLDSAETLLVAQSWASLLAGRTTDLWTEITHGLGLDRLSISTPGQNPSDTEGNYIDLAVGIGKYVSRGVFVSLDRNFATKDTRLSLAAELHKLLKLQVDVSNRPATNKVLLLFKTSY